VQCLDRSYRVGLGGWGGGVCILALYVVNAAYTKEEEYPVCVQGVSISVRMVTVFRIEVCRGYCLSPH